MGVAHTEVASRTPAAVSRAHDAVSGWPLRLTIPVAAIPYARAKRVLDVAVAATAILLASPLFVLAAALVRLTSPGAIIFRQTRVGRGGRLFTCYKFRSMCADAEQRRRSLAHLNEVSGPVFKIANDPRFSPVGRLLRKLSIDELPQLFNVLRGDMSIVGPRPPLPDEVAQYRERELGRLAVKPGLTCLWQVQGRSTIEFDRWVELDLQYIRTMTFWTDVRIILQTIPAVISTRGAH